MGMRARPTKRKRGLKNLKGDVQKRSKIRATHHVQDIIKNRKNLSAKYFGPGHPCVLRRVFERKLQLVCFLTKQY